MEASQASAAPQSEREDSVVADLVDFPSSETAPADTEVAVDGDALAETDPSAETAPDADAATETVDEAPAVPTVRGLFAANDERAAEVGARWFVCHTYATQEKVALSNVLIAGEKLGDHQFVEAQIPMESVEVRRGRKVERVDQPKYPGYLLVRAVPTDDVISTIRNVAGVVNFAGVIAGRPTAISDDEANEMLGRRLVDIVDATPKSKIPFTKGDSVVVISGPFENFEGTVDQVDEPKYRIKVLVEFFGQSTPVWLDPDQIMRRRA